MTFNMELSQRRAQICVDYMVAKGIAPMRINCYRVWVKTEPFVMDVKDGKLRPGAILNETFIDKLKRKKDIEKAHQYNRRTDFKVVLLILSMMQNQIEYFQRRSSLTKQ